MFTPCGFADAVRVWGRDQRGLGWAVAARSWVVPSPRTPLRTLLRAARAAPSAGGGATRRLFWRDTPVSAELARGAAHRLFWRETRAGASGDAPGQVRRGIDACAHGAAHAARQ